MIVEPFANDDVADNLNPVGRVYYSASTFICTPASLSQEVGLALGAQAGEARLRAVVTEAGFSRVRRAAETAFNIILDARPSDPAPLAPGVPAAGEVLSFPSTHTIRRCWVVQLEPEPRSSAVGPDLAASIR